MPEAAVEVDDLHVSYGDVRAVAGLSMTAPRGALTAVVGPNGGGKTTTVEVCEGLRAADSGSVRVLGLAPHNPALRTRVGAMLQDGGIPTMAKPLPYLRTLAALYANPQNPAMLLEWLGLAGNSTPFRRLSGGEQQRVKLAAALVGRPELVFLDEPSTGLDPSARHGMWELLAALIRDGVTVVLTTHQLAEAEALADHVVVVDRGRTVAAGTVTELVGPGSDVMSFGGPLHLDLATLAAVLPSGVQIKEVSPGQYRVAGEVSPQTIASVTAWCAQHGVAPRDLAVGRPTLEDAFLRLTGGDR